MGWKMWPRISFHWHSQLSTVRKASCLLGRCFLRDYRTNIFQRLITVSHLIICCCNHQVCSFDNNIHNKFLTVFSLNKTTNQKTYFTKKKPKTNQKKNHPKNPPPKQINPNKIKKHDKNQRKQFSLKQNLHTAYKEQKIKGNGRTEMLVPLLMLEVCQDLKSSVSLFQSTVKGGNSHKISHQNRPRWQTGRW